MSLLSSIGIGAATVDLVLPSARVTAGESVTGVVEVVGGNDEQSVEKVYCALRTAYRTDEGSHTATIAEYELTDGFTVSPDEELRFDVTLDVPSETPATVYGDTEVWIDTGLDIDWAADPDDKDELTVEPPAGLAALHDATGSLGFELDASGPVASAGTPLVDEAAFVQRFAYRPLSNEYRADLDELVVLADPTDDGIAVAMEVDAVDTSVSDREFWTEFEVTGETGVTEQLREEIDGAY